MLVQKRRDTKAARRFIRKLLSGQGAVSRVMVMGKLGSYGAANREIGLTVCDHSQHNGLNNRAEKFSSTHKTARAVHEALQVSTTLAAFRILSRPDLQPPSFSLRPLHLCY